MGCTTSRVVNDFLEAVKPDNNGKKPLDCGTPSELDNVVSQIENANPGKKVKRIAGVQLNQSVIKDEKGHETVKSKTWIMEVEFEGVNETSSFEVHSEGGKIQCKPHAGNLVVQPQSATTKVKEVVKDTVKDAVNNVVNQVASNYFNNTLGH